MNPRLIALLILVNFEIPLLGFQIDVYSEKNFLGIKTTLNISGCFSKLPMLAERNVASISTHGHCILIYTDENCSGPRFVKLIPNDPYTADVSKYGLYKTAISISECNPCPIKEFLDWTLDEGVWSSLEDFAFILSDEPQLSGNRWTFQNSIHNPQKKKNFCAKIQNAFAISIEVQWGCVQLYTTYDCTIVEDHEFVQLSKLPISTLPGITREVKSFSNCNFQCTHETQRSVLATNLSFYHKLEPTDPNHVRVEFSSGLRRDIHIYHWPECYNTANSGLSSPTTKVVARGICLVLFQNNNCNRNTYVGQPTLLNATAKGNLAYFPPLEGNCTKRDRNESFTNLSFMRCDVYAKFESFLNSELFTTAPGLFSNQVQLGTDRHDPETIDIANYFCFSLDNKSFPRQWVTPIVCVTLFTSPDCSGIGEILMPGSPVLNDISIFTSYLDARAIRKCANESLPGNGTYSVRMTSPRTYPASFLSHQNESDICWEIPFHYRALNISSVVVEYGCIQLYWDLNCSPFAQHFTITPNLDATELHTRWDIYRFEGSFPTSPGSFGGCKLNFANWTTKLVIPDDRFKEPLYIDDLIARTKLGAAQTFYRIDDCENIPRQDLNEPRWDWSADDEVLIWYVHGACIFFFDDRDCQMSSVAVFPVLVDARNQNVERNVASHPIWDNDKLNVKSVSSCDYYRKAMSTIAVKKQNTPKLNFTRNFNETRIPSPPNSIYIIIPITVVISLLVISALGAFFIYQRRKTLANIITKEEVDLFYKGSDKPSATVEDTIQNMEISTEFQISPKSFTYVYLKNGKLDLLGSGAFGVVVKGLLHSGFDSETGTPLTRHVGIKKPRIGITQEQIRSLLCEIKINLYIGKHPNIVEFLGFTDTDIRHGQVCVILELCENGSLLQFLQKHKKEFETKICQEGLHLATVDNYKTSGNVLELNTLTLLQFCQEIAEGMEFLASKQVCHSDLATRNVLLDSNNCAKISDFGLSRKLYNYGNYIKKGKDLLLPWRWMAIECLKSFNFSVKSDIWSMGVVMWEMFSFGETPYPNLEWNKNFVEDLSNDLRLEKPKSCPDECYQLMTNCWAEEPKDRPNFTELRNGIALIRMQFAGMDAPSIMPQYDTLE